MQTALPLLPELDFMGNEEIPAPVRGPGDLATSETDLDLPSACLKHLPAL
jgi:hypothetical protein